MNVGVGVRIPFYLSPFGHTVCPVIAVRSFCNLLFMPDSRILALDNAVTKCSLAESCVVGDELGSSMVNLFVFIFSEPLEKLVLVVQNLAQTANPRRTFVSFSPKAQSVSAHA